MSDTSIQAFDDERFGRLRERDLEAWMDGCEVRHAVSA